MIADDESDIIFQLKPSKKIKKQRRNTLRIQKHYENLNNMQSRAQDQERIIAALIESRLKLYSKNKDIMQWKSEVSIAHASQYINLIKSESETFEESEFCYQQPNTDISIEGYLS